LTEEQLGGTAPQPEASASTADQSTQPSVATIAVADEPATPVTDTTSPATDMGAEATADTTDSVDEQPAVDASNDGLEPAGAATIDGTEPVAAAPEPDGMEPVAAAPEPDGDSVAPGLMDGAGDVTAAVQGEAMTGNGVDQDELADAPAASDEADADVAEPVVQRPEPTTMAELLAEQNADIKSFKHGDVVEGSVVRIDKDEILVDIGAKSEGVVSNRELYGRHAESQPQLAIGDVVLVYVLQPESQEGHVVLSLRRAGLERKWRAMQEQFEAGAIIEAPVIDHNKGGLIVDCGIRGFVPISQIVDFPRRPQNDQPRDAAQEIAEKLQPFVGRKLRLKILEVNRKANRLILSEKVALYEERREKRDELFSSLLVGQKVTGTVRSIAPFGVFVDLGGIDGLVHKSELSWNKVNNPESGYRVGEEVEAEVIDINHERGRISLSIRRLQPDPWHSTVADFTIGDVIDGTVTKLVNFGAFVRVRDGLEGLIHISELSHQRVAHPGDVVHEGQELKLKIISLDSERHRLGLSLKQAEEPPARPTPPEPVIAQPRAERSERPDRGDRRPRPERGYSMSDAVQEPEGGIDNTLASAFAQVRQQMAATERAATEGSADESADAPAEAVMASSDAADDVASPEPAIATAAVDVAAGATPAEEPAAMADAEAPTAETATAESPAADVADAGATDAADALEAATPEPEAIAAPEAETQSEPEPQGSGEDMTTAAVAEDEPAS